MGFISDVFRKARKEHSCYLCGGKIKKGDEYRRSFLSDGGDAYSLCEHKDCYDLIPEMDAAYLMEMGEYTSDDFCDAVTELCRSKICPNCQHWDKEAKECSEDKWIIQECMDKVWEFGRTHCYDSKKHCWVKRENDGK